MEKQYAHPSNGDELRSQDVDSISENAALADDRVLWELFRTKAGSATPDKLIVPYNDRVLTRLSGSTSHALVFGNSANGSVQVMPFRAIVGSTTVIGTSATEHMRGQHSGYYVGTSTLYTVVPITANASGNPRWTLVYAAVTPGASGDTASLLNKDPTTKVVSTNTRTINTKTTVTVSTVDGTPAGSPTRPAVPSDAAGTYYIALAYVYVPNGFNASSTVLREYLHEVAPCAVLTSSVGASSLRPASETSKSGGNVDTNQSGSSSTQRPGAYLPSTMVGGDSRVVLVQLGYSPISHNDGDVVDDSIDWRFRYFRWMVHARGGSTAATAFASDRRLTGGATPSGSAVNTTYGTNIICGMGQSFVDDSSVMISTASCSGVAAYVDQSTLGIVAGPYKVQLAVRSTDGALIYKKTGTIAAQLIFWIDATAPYSNFGTI